MPNMDRTGPEGKGPKTGRGMGKCEGAETRRGFGIFRLNRERRNQINQSDERPRNRRFLNRRN